MTRQALHHEQAHKVAKQLATKLGRAPSMHELDLALARAEQEKAPMPARSRRGRLVAMFKF